MDRSIVLMDRFRGDTGGCLPSGCLEAVDDLIPGSIQIEYELANENDDT
jgi:hypothetical protein